MHPSFLQETGIALAVVCTVWIAARVVRNARRLNAGVRAFKAEQEKQGGAMDPYALLSSLYDPTKRPTEETDGKSTR
jgi:hypothetical protein